MFSSVRPTAEEIQGALPGDDLVPGADIVMNRAFTVPGPPDVVWPWLVQLGKARAGWYLPRAMERVIAPGRRALRRIEPKWQSLAVGDSIPDYGGRDATFEVAALTEPEHIVYTSQRGRISASWAIALSPLAEDRTRVRLRLRLAHVRRRWLAESLGGLVDLLTIAGMAAGLRERLQASDRPASR